MWIVQTKQEVLTKLEQYGYEAPIQLDEIGLVQIGVVLEELGFDLGGCNPDIRIKAGVLEIKKGGF